jgi:hypothetical protein
MALCALLLRTQSLYSSSRSANFDPSNPSNVLTKDSISPDLWGVISVAHFCLLFPLVFSLFLYIIVNNNGLQETWNRIKANVTSAHMRGPKKPFTVSKQFALESPRCIPGLRSEVSASRSVSPFSPSSLHVQSSHFSRPAGHVLPVADTRYCSSASELQLRASNQDATLEVETEHALPSPAASSFNRLQRVFKEAHQRNA